MLEVTEPPSRHRLFNSCRDRLRSPKKTMVLTETSHRKYNFVKAPPNINALLTVDPKPHLCQLWKNEGTHLSLPQREEINSLLEKYEE
ncbi:hypothetical protein TNCV_3153701 [Trichonephila clavipes]|nr:hypothetical protein TNCV_3153701 [Trichonephila clavipes]